MDVKVIMKHYARFLEAIPHIPDSVFSTHKLSVLHHRFEDGRYIINVEGAYFFLFYYLTMYQPGNRQMHYSLIDRQGIASFFNRLPGILGYDDLSQKWIGLMKFAHFQTLPERFASRTPGVIFTYEQQHSICFHMVQRTLRELQSRCSMHIGTSGQFLEHMIASWNRRSDSSSTQAYEQGIRKLIELLVSDPVPGTILCVNIPTKKTSDENDYMELLVDGHPLYTVLLERDVFLSSYPKTRAQLDDEKTQLQAYGLLSMYGSSFQPGFRVDYDSFWEGIPVDVKIVEHEVNKYLAFLVKTITHWVKIQACTAHPILTARKNEQGFELGLYPDNGNEKSVFVPIELLLNSHEEARLHRPVDELKQDKVGYMQALLEPRRKRQKRQKRQKRVDEKPRDVSRAINIDSDDLLGQFKDYHASISQSKLPQ
jgi:hypothetical protein